MYIDDHLTLRHNEATSLTIRTKQAGEKKKEKEKKENKVAEPRNFIAKCTQGACE